MLKKQKKYTSYPKLIVNRKFLLKLYFYSLYQLATQRHFYIIKENTQHSLA